MNLKKIKITNFKCFKETFTLDFTQGLNVLVGKNEVGKSTILEAINLAITGYYHGKSLRNEISQYLFNTKSVDEYTQNIRSGLINIEPPRIDIEVFYDGDNYNPEFEGNNNSERRDKICGFKLSIALDEKYKSAYEALIREKGDSLHSLPLEYYEARWETFARQYITPKDIQLSCSLIDSSRNTYRNFSDVYVSRIIRNSVDEQDRVAISQAYRELVSNFSNNESIASVNEKLGNIEYICGSQISIGVELGSSTSWESALMPLADKIPFTFIGKGKQCVLKTEISLRSKAHEKAGIVLIEEPESHLSHSYLHKLVAHIEKASPDKQLIISTHSSYVANKLGLCNIIMLNEKKALRLNSIDEETANYFKKLSGYDTLRYILCERAILVEGPSDDLIIQKAYRDEYGRYPSEDGIDIIEVGTSYERFLKIACELSIMTTVVIDNDGKTKKLKEKRDHYQGYKCIKFCFENEINSFSDETMKKLGEKFNINTLEPYLLSCNDAGILAEIFEVDMTDTVDLLKYMKAHKTDCALKIYSCDQKIKYPRYILDALCHE